MKRIIVFIVLMFLLSSTHLVLAETRNVECTSNLQCPNGVCDNFVCVSREPSQPPTLPTNNIDDSYAPLVGVFWVGGIIVILLIIIIFILIKKKKNKGGLEK